MIIVQDKYNADIKIPRNPSYNGRFDLRIFSPIGLWEKSYYVVDDYSSKQFYHFQVDLWSLPNGEFNYILESEEAGEAAATGIIQVGDGKAEDEYLQYQYEIEYLQYYPFQAEIVLKVSEESLKYDDTEIEFTIYSNVDWVYTIYRNGSQYGNTTHGSKGKSKQYIDIPENNTKELVIWEIACGDEDGNLSVSKKIWQYGLPLSVSITTPNPTIAASVTTIPFTITYDEWQTTRTGTIYLYKDGTENDSMPLNYYPLTFSSAFTISPNLTENEVEWDLKVVVKEEGSSPMISASTRVIQEAAAAPTPTADTSTRFSVVMLEDGDIEWEGRGYEYYDIIRDGVRDEGNQLDHGVINLKAGDIVEFYLMTDNTNQINTSITSVAKHNVFGNIMSLIFADYTNVSAITTEYQFVNLFKGDTGLLSAENLLLPAKYITWGTYEGMFWNCTNLTTPPAVLPATRTKNSSYTQMFQGCTSLATMPIISATSDYSQFMFAGCTSLTESTTLNRGDDNMFIGCTNLSYIKCLAYHPASMSDEDLKQKNFNWVENVSPTGTFVKKRGSKWLTGNHGIPENWTIVEVDE